MICLAPLCLGLWVGEKLSPKACSGKKGSEVAGDGDGDGDGGVNNN
jgi:hypothetical protein